MLTKVQMLSSQPSASELVFDEDGRAEDDLIQVRDISGLDPVETTVTTSSLGSIDGVAYVGQEVPGRNIVLTLHPNPDWSTWSFEKLRQFIYAYLMPRASVRLIFYSDENPPVKIEGIVESLSANPFSSDPEYLVSIICPDPYFTALDATYLSGPLDGSLVNVPNTGTIPTGIYLKLDYSSGGSPTDIQVQVQNSLVISNFQLNGIDSNDKYFELSSVPRQKYAREVSSSSGIITNRISEIQPGSVWPVLQAGLNLLGVLSSTEGGTWQLTYYERLGGI